MMQTLVPPRRIELPTSWLQIRRSASWATRAILAPQVGFDPTYDILTGCCFTSQPLRNLFLLQEKKMMGIHGGHCSFERLLSHRRFAADNSFWPLLTDFAYRLSTFVEHHPIVALGSHLLIILEIVLVIGAQGRTRTDTSFDISS